MNPYRPRAPRAAFALCAAALTVATLLVTVYVPARWDSGFEPATTLADARPGAPPPTEVAIVPARIDVVGVREPDVARAVARPVAPNVAWALPPPGDPNCRPAT